MTYQLIRFGKKIALSAGTLVILWALFSVQMALAQSPITASAEPTRLSVDDQLTLNVTISGDFLTIPNPDMSGLQDFVIVSSSTSTQVSIVNGKMSSQKIFIYRLRPLKEGSLVIGPISVNINGQVYETDPIDVEVLGSGSQVSPPGEDSPPTDAPDTLEGKDFFVEAEIDNPTPYLGQQVIYIFRLYQATNFMGQPDYQPPAFTDFWSSEILSQPHYSTEAGGQKYLVSEIRTALFPANLGPLTIEPATLVIPGTFLSPDIKLETNPVTLDVQPLPEGAPANFSGAVGQFNIQASLTPTETKVNEPVTLRIEIEGTGNIQTITEPELPELLNWRMFESQASTKIDKNDDVISGIRTFERLVVPGQSGEQIFPAISFSYYDPQAETYRTINTEPIKLMVAPNNAAPAPPPAVDANGNGQLSVDRISADIRHIKPAPATLRAETGRLATVWQLLYWCGWVLPVLFVGGVQIWHKRRERLRRDTAYARDLRARRTALNILADARRGEAGDYANAAGRALLGYLSDKLNTPTAGLTTDNLINVLRDSGLDNSLVERVKTILEQIDIGRFAPISAGAGRAIIDDTQQLINELEKSFGKRR